MDADVEAAVGGVCLAVGVDQAGGGAGEDKLPGGVREDVRAAVDRAEEEPRGERHGAERADLADGGEVERAVAHAGAGRDAGVVAV